MDSTKVCLVVGLMLVMLISISTVSSDPDMLQDICVADLTSAVKVNGYPCKSSNVSADDFFFAGIASPGPTSKRYGSLVTGANVQNIPGLNTLGISLARIDFAPGGLNPPHVHPRATEVIFVLEGMLDCWFITTANVLFSKTINKGEVFVFPKGLVHFQQNNWKTNTSVLSAFNSQLSGTQSIAITLFGATPAVPDSVLAKAFQVDTDEVQKIKSMFMM